jgi:hypothetical protein
MCYGGYDLWLMDCVGFFNVHAIVQLSNDGKKLHCIDRCIIV